MARWGSGLGYRTGIVGGNLLAFVLQLDDAQLIGHFLTHVAVCDSSVELDAPVAKAFDAHGWNTFQNALTAVVESTTAETIGRNVRLLDRLCSTGSRPKGERLTVCGHLTEKTVVAIERLDQEDVSTNWRLRDVNRAEVLTGLTRALLATEQFDLLSRFMTHALADTKRYPLSAHIAALTSIGPWLKKHLKKPCEPVSRWLAACCTQLETLTAVEPSAPTDFRREANVRCDCADCKELKTFLKDPVEKAHRFRVRQDRRQHLEHEIKGHQCDLDCVTDRSGSPQTLVCTKNTASFEARLKKYREDLAHLAALRSIVKNLPT